VQGQLRNESLRFAISTECGHCHRPLNLEIDSQLNYRVIEEDAEPLVFVPMMGKIKDKSIIDTF
jgi:hypothetical protein